MPEEKLLVENATVVEFDKEGFKRPTFNPSSLNADFKRGYRERIQGIDLSRRGIGIVALR